MQQEGQASIIPPRPIKEAFHRHTHGGRNLLGSRVIYGQRLRFLLKKRNFFLLSKKKNVKKMGGRRPATDACEKEKKKERKVEKRDSP